MDSAWIGETFTSSVGWDHLERLVDIGNRMAGQDGEREGLEATRDVLSEVGARDAHIEAFDLQGWRRGDSAIRAGRTTQRAIALPRSPAGEVAGELVDLGHGLPEDFEDAALDGAVAMVRTDVPDDYDRFVHRREKYYDAVESGADAFVFRNHVPGNLPPTGSVGTEADPVGAIPAVGVSREVGARLARRFDGDAVTVAVDCETPAATSGNVRAALGPDTDEVVYLTSHVDAHDVAEGAMDNGAGTAMVVEAARALAGMDLDTRIRVVPFGAEEVGLLGSAHEVDSVDLDRVKAVVNVDGVCQGRTLRCHTHGFDGLADAVEAVADRLDHPIDAPSGLNPHSDHWNFVAEGVPGVMVSSDSGDRGRGWGHTEADTLDKLEQRTFREQAILVTALVAHLVAADVDVDVAHRPREAIASELEAQNLAEGMRVTGDWPY
jgi:Zn-dependent M28 family amino/carboxypeptidase